MVDESDGIIVDSVLDVKEESCPLPLLKAKLALNRLSRGQSLKVIATDRASLRDFPAYCRVSGNRLLASGESGGVCVHIIKKQMGT